MVPTSAVTAAVALTAVKELDSLVGRCLLVRSEVSRPLGTSDVHKLKSEKKKAINYPSVQERVKAQYN